MPKKLTPAGSAAPPVEPNLAQASIPRKPPTKRAAAKPTKPTSDTKYVRNLHQIQARVTLTTGREIHLEPRGQREDLDIVTTEERQDPRFLANLGLIFEVIDAADAELIISKQRHNSNHTENPIWSQLRNEKGEGYTQRVMQIEESFENQGTVVGQIEEKGSGRFTDKNFEVTRTAGPRYTDAPGSPGHPATEAMLNTPDISAEEFAEFLLWKKFKASLES